MSLIKSITDNYNSLDKGKKMVITVLIPVILVMITIMGFVINHLYGNKSEELSSNPLENLSLESIKGTETNIHLTAEKTRAYNIREQLEKVKVDQDTAINIESPHKLIQQNIEKQNRNIPRNAEEKLAINTSSISEVKKDYSKPKRSSTTQKSVRNVDKKENIRHIKVEKEEPQEPEFTSRFHRSSIESRSRKANDIYYDAFLESDIEIYEGKELVFILDKDYVIEGKKFNKMSLLYCSVSESDERLHITTNRIQDTRNQVHNISLIAYNENYFKGIPVGSRKDKRAEEGASEVVDEVAYDIPYGRTARSVVKELRKPNEKKRKVSLPKGYVMKFKKEEK